jgi:hypothetical protein
MSKRTLHAVLAGINDYLPPVTPLSGCAHDVQVLHDLLEQEDSFDCQITVLTNAQVTKQALVHAWSSALGNAKKGDVVFLYYSGHGTREQADLVFSNIEQDEALECLVCYDSVQYVNDTFAYQMLADKEIHYLISKCIDDVHIITMFDCCHSGGVTRNMLLPGEGDVRTRRYVPTDRMGMKVPQRRWTDFIFAHEIDHGEVQQTGWMSLVPQRPHITMSACQNDESAFEKDGKGIFTNNLLETLARSGSRISYYDLHARVRMLTQNQFRQTPEIYTTRGHENDLLKGWLDRTRVQKGFRCTCTFHPDYGWTIDLGAIHGLSHYSGPVSVFVGKEIYEAGIDHIHGHFSQIQFSRSEARKLDEASAYSGKIDQFTAANTSFYLKPSEEAVEVSSEIEKALRKKEVDTTSSSVIVDVPEQAQYIIIVGEQIRICINDEALRPVTEVTALDPLAVKRLMKAMVHIAQWEYIRSLYNPDYKQAAYPVGMYLYRITPFGTQIEVVFEGDTVYFDYDENALHELTGKMKLKIANDGNVKYYCALLYMSNTFQIYGNMLDGKVVGLNSSESAWVYNGDVIELDLERHVVDFNFEFSIFYLKLLVNPQPFAIDSLEQSPLPTPQQTTGRGIDQEAQRGLKTRKEEAVEVSNWFTRTICFKGRNPHYRIKSEPQEGHGRL